MNFLSRRFLLRVAVLALLMLVYLTAVAAIFHKIESWTWPEAFYFSAVTLTTVGYGDLHPTTDASRLVATAFVLVSIPLFFLTLGIVGEAAFLSYQHGGKQKVGRGHGKGKRS